MSQSAGMELSDILNVDRKTPIERWTVQEMIKLLCQRALKGLSPF